MGRLEEIISESIRKVISEVDSFEWSREEFDGIDDERYKDYLRSTHNENFEGKKYYHTVINRKWMDWKEVIRSVFRNGLVPVDNGENGRLIWFSSNPKEYSGNGKLTLSLEYGSENRAEYNLINPSEGGMFALWPIPFGAMEIYDCPIMYGRNFVLNAGNFRNSEDFVRSLDGCVRNQGSVTVFSDVAEMFFGSKATTGIFGKDNVKVEKLFV